MRELVEDLPADLDRLIVRCLRKDPQRRWQAMSDLKVALQELKEESDSGKLAAPVTASAAKVSTSRRWIAVIGAVAAVGVAATLVMLARRSPPAAVPPATIFTPTPLTTLQGREQGPSFSPDGNSVAFAWNGEDEANWDIYVKLVGPGPPLRFTTDSATDLSPAWSRDGRSIAFIRDRGRTVRPSSSCRLLGGPSGRSSSASRRCCAAPSSVWPGRPTVERSSLFRLWRQALRLS